MKGLRVSDEELRVLLVNELEVITKAEFESAQNLAKRFRTTVGRILVERGHVPQGFLLGQLAHIWGVGYIDLKVSDVNQQALQLIDEEFARNRQLIPFDLQNNHLKLAMCDPRDRATIDQIQNKTRLKVIPHLAPGPAIQRAHLLYKGDLRQMLKRASMDKTLIFTAAPRTDGKETSATELLTRILEYAAVTQASDIHIEPYEFETLVRYRIDGVLHEVLSLPPEAQSSLISRIKVLSLMRIDEKRAPQDGRFESHVGELVYEYRVSTLPIQWGEKIVMRVLSKEVLSFGLEDLGLIEDDYKILLRNLLRPYGMILITGPTGTGKSTSLYAMLMRLGAERRYVVNISTVEDPVEYNLPRVNQVTVSSSAGLIFPVALRALLRQDPDIIMVGEIRDRETAEIAVRAALVGRLLISTLHTNDATGAVPRLIDMGIEPFLLASTLSLVVGQRLVRRMCTKCRESVPPNPSVLAALKERRDFNATIQALQAQGALGKGDDPLAGIRLFKGKGCPQCQGTGFRGRLGVFELFEVGDEIRNMIMERKDANAIRAVAISKGMKTLFQDGLAKVFLGETTLEEVARVAL